MCETTIEEGVFQLSAPDTRWLSTGYDGGYRIADAVYNVSVPSGWSHENLAAYVDQRRERAGLTTPGPTLLTGVDLTHARGARYEDVEVYATVGLSNPATLPMATGDEDHHTADAENRDVVSDEDRDGDSDEPTVGTVNLVVRTSRPLTDGALATLVGTAVEAKTATLLSLTGFTGTTTDAFVAGAPATGDRERWAGSGTALGNATRVCVRDAIQASFDSRYADTDVPDAVERAEHGVVTEGSATVFQP